MADKLIYIHNNDAQYYPFCRLQLNSKILSIKSKCPDLLHIVQVCTRGGGGKDIMRMPFITLVPQSLKLW